MAEHPNKHIREAIKYALKKSWRLLKAGPRAHVWGQLFCPLARRGGCILSESSVRQGIRKTTPEGLAKRSTIVPMPEARATGAKMKRKKIYGFSLVLTAPALSADECDALYEAGCDDGTIVTRNRVTFIAFDRKADSLEQAIRSATADVRTAGFEIKRVEMPALV